jgi:hypothetical protein
MKRPVVISSVLAIVAAAALWWSGRDGAAPATSNHAASGPAQRNVPPRFAAAPPAADERPSAGDPGARYMKKYDGRSGRLTRAVEPEARYAALPVEVKRPGGPLISVRATPPRAELGTPVDLEVALPEAGTVVSSVAWQPRLASRALGDWRPMSPEGPITHRARWTVPETILSGGPSEEPPPPAMVDLTVRVSGTFEGRVFTQEVTTSVFAQRSGAHLAAGTQTMEARDGNVVFAIDATIEQRGPYFAYAELWSTGDDRRPIAFARQRMADLPPGRQRIELLFGGEILRDSGVDGPYEVRSVELSAVSTIPPHRAQPIAEAGRTPAWEHSRFH